VQAWTRFQLPVLTGWASDTNQKRVSRPDRSQFTIWWWFVLAHTSCRVRLLVVVQVDLHEEGHNASRNQGGFTEACLQFRLSKAGRPLHAAEISEEPRINRLSPRSGAQKKPRAAVAKQGKTSSQGEKVARSQAIQRS
jgi:hypothetical protein